MSFLKNTTDFIMRFCLPALLLSSLLLASTTASAVLNRRSVVALVKNVNADYDSGRVSVFINELDGDADPGLKVGDELSYHITVSEPRYLLFLLVDPKGMVNVVFPDYLVSDKPETYTSFVYPPEETGSLIQGEPVGVETIIALASSRAIELSELGMREDSDIHLIGKNEMSINDLVNRVNSLLAGSETDAAVYQYFVDSDVQFGTRSVRRELKKRVEQVDVLAEQKNISTEPGGNGNRNSAVESDAIAVNDIRFETNSDALTSVGKTQLDMFGSELLNIWEANPTISVTFEGHTDDTGDATYNQNLSERRAASAKRYLVDEYGLPESNILTRGMGEMKPLTANADSVSRSLNRRVEILIRSGVN